jgi:signal transduction histidine kinase
MATFPAVSRNCVAEIGKMTLRRKSFFIISATLAGLVLLLYGVSRLILLDSYQQLERSAVVADTERVSNSINSQLQQLGRTTVDWAYWDDTLEFVQGRYDEYINDNLTIDTLVNLDLNFTIYQDRHGQVIFSKFVNLEEEIETMPSFSLEGDLLQVLTPDPQDLLSGVTGIMKVNGRPMLVASRHILNNQGEGPSAGTLIFGAYLDEARIAVLEEMLTTHFTLYDVGDPTLPSLWQEIITALGNSDQVAVQPQDRESISGYRILADIQREPAYLLKVDLPRTLYRQGLATLAYFVTNLLFFGVIVIVVTLLLMNRLVLAPLGRLHEGVTRIKHTGNLALTVEAAGNDEIAGLGRVLNDLLAEVESSRDQLQSFNRELERRVAERTEALASVNQALRAEVNERKQTEVKLAAARDQALESLRLKAQILANVSHDVRTPLNVINLRCEMLMHQNDEPLKPRQKKLLETILFSSGELLRFFDNLLQQSQAQDKKVKIVQAPFSPRELVREVEMLMLPQAEKKGLSWRSEVDANLPLLLIGDQERLKQILNNLADNAIKFTEVGEVVVHLARRGEEKWAMVVSDTGHSIAEKDKDQIFDAFWQVDGSPTRRVNRGVGLGLFIVKELTLLMGGEVGIALNENGSGSTFVVTLPLQREGESNN